MAHGRTDDRPDDWLIELLDDVGPEPPATVDLAYAISEGRRRIRRRRLAGVAGAMVAVVATGAVPATIIAHDDRDASRTPDDPAESVAGPAPVSCQASRLSAPVDSYQSIVTAADPTVSYIAGRVYFAGPRIRVLFWDHGQQRDVDMPGEDGAITDINAHGVAVGFSYTGEGVTTAWLYRDGRLTPLPGGNARAIAINDRGDVVGDLSSEPWSPAPTPVLWRAGSDRPTPLPVPEGRKFGSVTDIDEDGTILGTIHGPGGIDESGVRDTMGYVWRPDGTATELAGLTAESRTRPAALRGGWVVGQDMRDAGQIRKFTAVRWNLGTGEIAAYPTADMVSPRGVNASGWVVGERTPILSVPPGEGPPPDGPHSPLGVITDAGTVDLPGFETPEATGSTGSAMTITVDGRTIAGTAEDRAGNPRATVWHCQ